MALQSILCEGDGRILLTISDLSIRQGERVAIIGHNGAGKSTLLRLLSGFLVPSKGKITVLGHTLEQPLSPPQLQALRRTVGQVMQGLHLVARLSARENVLIGSLGRLSGWRSWTRCYPADELARADAALMAVGLFSRADTRADRLSGGERQKVAIARLLMQRPQIILADEPTAALDPAAATEICRLLSQAAADATLLTVVHNPALLPLLADRVIGLKQGGIAFDLPLAAVNEEKLLNLYCPEPKVESPPYPQHTTS